MKRKRREKRRKERERRERKKRREKEERQGRRERRERRGKREGEERERREKRETARENLCLQVMRFSLSCYDTCQIYITRSINKQPIATHLSVNNSQSEYAVRFLQSERRVRS